MTRHSLKLTNNHNTKYTVTFLAFFFLPPQTNDIFNSALPNLFIKQIHTSKVYTALNNLLTYVQTMKQFS